MSCVSTKTRIRERAARAATTGRGRVGVVVNLADSAERARTRARGRVAARRAALARVRGSAAADVADSTCLQVELACVASYARINE